MAWHCREAAVSFVLDWSPAANETAAEDDAVTTAQGPETTNDGAGCECRTAAEEPAARRGGGGGGGNDNAGDAAAAAAAKWAAQARKEEREQQEKGREALLRLGIFLEKHEVQEDTVDVLSSAGWL